MTRPADQSVALGRTRAPRLSVSCDSRGNLNNLIANPRLIGAECGDPVAYDLANKPSARILIETEVNGQVDLFQFIDFRRSFHGAASTEGAKPDHVAR